MPCGPAPPQPISTSRSQTISCLGLLAALLSILFHFQTNGWYYCADCHCFSVLYVKSIAGLLLRMFAWKIEYGT